MLQANLYDSEGELGLWNPIDTVKDAASFLKEKTVDGAQASYKGVKTAGAYVLDKTCASTRDPRLQVAMAAAAAIPSGYTQAAAAGYAATGAACAVFYPDDMPQIPGPALDLQALQVPMMASFVQFKSGTKAALPGTIRPTAVVPGTIAAFDPKRGVYRVAVPGLPGFSAPAAFTEVNSQAEKPAGAQLVALKTFETQTGTAKPWFKKPLVLGGIAAGVLVVGGGSYLALRR